MDSQAIITVYLEMRIKLIKEFQIPVRNLTWGNIDGLWCANPLNHQNVCLYFHITKYTIKLRIIEDKWKIQLCDENKIALIGASVKFYSLTDPQLPQYIQTVFKNNSSTR